MFLVVPKSGVAQAGLLTAAFYFIYHTTSPLLVDWASSGNEKNLTYEFDFAYFYRCLNPVPYTLHPEI